jgi:ElaB/YqjD/DUF883 family membrane-anchored ribosome-binding protein
MDDIRKDLQTLRDDLSRLAGQMSTLVSAKGDEAFGEVRTRMRQMGDAVTDMGERSRDMVTDMADTLGATLEENVRTRPLATIGFAVGLGFIVGAMWRR